MSCMQCGGDRSSMVRLDQDIRSTSGAGGQLNIGYFGDGKAVTLGGECATNVARREPMSNDVPVLTTEQIKEASARGNERARAARDDADDRRLHRGKYAPEKGMCSACHGVVSGKIHVHHPGMLGDPPQPSSVSHWECEGCGLMYGRCPKSNT